MTLDEAIEMCENVVIFSSKEYEQLAKWLEELKELREFKAIYQKGMDYSYATFMYNKAIDDLTEKIVGYGTYDYYGNVVHVLEIADELKKRCAE